MRRLWESFVALLYLWKSDRVRHHVFLKVTRNQTLPPFSTLKQKAPDSS